MVRPTRRTKVRLADALAPRLAIVRVADVDVQAVSTTVRSSSPRSTRSSHQASTCSHPTVRSARSWPGNTLAYHASCRPFFVLRTLSNANTSLPVYERLSPYAQMPALARTGCAHNRRVCTTANTWSPSWHVSSLMMGILSFMLEDTPTVGSVETSPAQKRQLAASSHAFNLKDRAFVGTRVLVQSAVERH